MALLGILVRFGALVAYALWAPNHLDHPYIVGFALVTVWWLLELTTKGGRSAAA